MAKQSINVGSSANDRQGDSLRAAFQKVNANFTELYTALGLATDINLNLGAFEFSGSTMSTTDSTAITIDQATTVTSDLTVGGDIIPQTANGGDLGSAARPWKSLYVSGSTIYLGGNALKVDANGELILNNNPIVQANGNYISLNLNVNDVNISDPQVGDTLQWAGGFWINVPAESTTGDLKGSVFADDSTLLVDAVSGSIPYSVLSGAPIIPTDISQLTDTGNLIGSNPFNQDLDTTDSPNFVNMGLAGTAGAGYATLSVTIDRDFYIGLNDTSTGAKTFEFGRDGRLLVPGALYVDGNVYGGAGDRLYLAGDIGESVPAINIPNSTEGATSPLSINNTQGGGVQIETGAGNWLFDDTRLLYFPTSSDDEYNIGESVDGFNIRSDGAFGIAANFTTDAKYWLFDTDGGLTIPGDIKSEGAINININLSDSTLRRWTFGEDGDLTLPTGFIKPSTTDKGLIIEGPNYADFVTQEGGGINTISNGVNIVTHRAGTNAERRWTFAWDGALYPPNEPGDYQIGTIEWRQTAPYDITNQIRTTEGNGVDQFPGLKLVTYPSGANDAAITLEAGFSNRWIFKNDGSLQIPGDIKSEKEINISVNLTDSTTRTWRFGEDGNTEFPGNITAQGFIGTSTENLRVESEQGKISLNNSKSDSLATYADSEYTSASWSGNNIDFTAVEDIYLETLLERFDSHFAGSGSPWAAGYSNITVRINDTQTLTVTGASFSGGTNWRVEVAETPASDPTAVTTAEFFYDFVSTLELDRDNNSYAIALDDSNFRVNTRRDIRLESGDDIYIDGRSSMRLRNLSRTSGITIETDWNNEAYEWRFGEDGTFQIPGDTAVAGHITGTSSASTLVLGAEPNSNTYIQLNDTVDSTINTVANLEIRTDVAGTAKTWTFGTDGSLEIPGDIKSENAVNIDINLSDSTLRRWTFGEDGDLTLPDYGTIQVTSGTLTVSAENYILMDVTGGGQINIGNDNPNGTPIVLGNKFYNGTVNTYGDLFIKAGVMEKFSSLSGATGVVTHNCANGHIFYHTTPSANWTVNLTNFGILLNHATTVTVVIEQGGTGYYPNAVQIDGNAVPLVWQGNATPTPSSNRIDVVTFSILYDGLYTVLGQLTGF